MSFERVTVNKKGQLTIPSKFRKQLDIKEGTKLLVTQEESSLVFRRLPEIDDLLGIHAGKLFEVELQFELDKMRRQDRY
jgi:AbrB family looped-hinge helix DNA binding protein